MSSSATTFYYATCQRGAEQALKHEVSLRGTDLRLAFSRPGFVTFKRDSPESEDDLRDQNLMAQRWVFARTFGKSICRVTGPYLHQLARAMWEQADVVEQTAMRRFHQLHVWERDLEVPGRRGFEPGLTPMAFDVDDAVRAAAPPTVSQFWTTPLRQLRPAGRNQNVLDVVVVQPDEWWVGWHRVVTPQHRWPGGMIPLEMPDHAVSRAYLKMAEGLQWSDFPIRAGDEWVEIGCAPGGASQALLDRGQFVTGIDPAEVDESVLANPRFRHLRKRGADVRRREFRDVRWLAADLNVVPRYTLDTIEGIVTHRESTIRGMIITLKLPSWELAEQLPAYVERIRTWGYRDVRIRQLAHNSQEVCVVALRHRSLRRFSRRAHQRRRRRSVRTDATHRKLSGPHFRSSPSSQN